MALTRAQESYLTDIRYGRRVENEQQMGDFRLSPVGDLGLIDAEANVRQAVYHRIITSPGSVAYRPDYGVGLKDFMGAPNKISIQATLFNRLLDSFREEPRVERLESLSVDEVNDNYIRVTVKYLPVGLPLITQSIEV